MRAILSALFLYAAYSVVKTITTAQALSMEVVGIKPGISQGLLNLNLKMRIINKLYPVTLNSISGSVLLNDKKVGIINYNNNDQIPTGTNLILVPVIFDPLLDTANIITIISAEGFKNIRVNGFVTIDNIQLPYDNEILRSEPFKNFIDAAKL